MRTISGPAAAVLSGSVVPMALLLEIGTSPAIRLASSAVTLSWTSVLWYGVGTLGVVEAIADAPGQTPGLRFTLSAVPTDALALALGDTVKGATVKVWFAVLDPTTYAILDAPLVWTGAVDQMPIARANGQASISVTAAHRGETFNRPKPLRNTDNDQQKLVAGDTSRRFVVSQSQKQDVWPAAAFFRR